MAVVTVGQCYVLPVWCDCGDQRWSPSYDKRRRKWAFHCFSCGADLEPPEEDR